MPEEGAKEPSCPGAVGCRCSDSVDADTWQCSAPFPSSAVSGSQAKPSLPLRKGDLISADSGAGSAESVRLRTRKDREERDFRGGGDRELCPLEGRVLVSPDWRGMWVDGAESGSPGRGPLENRAAVFSGDQSVRGRS